MPTLDEILNANLGTATVPTVPRYSSLPDYGPAGVQEIERRKEELQKVRSAAERSKEDLGRFEEAGGMLKRQIQEKAAYEKERGLLDIERGRPIPKELPEFVPPKQTFDELFSMLMVGIGTGTGAGRGNYMIAANAMIGAMEGYQKGKKDQLNNAIKEFDIAVKRAAQEEKINIARYNQIVNDKKLTLGEKIRQISIQANAVDDKIMAAKTRRGSLDEVLKEINRQETALTSFEEKRLKAEQDLANEMRRRQERKEDQADARAATLASKAPQLVEVKLADGTMEVRDLNRMKFDESGRPVLGAGESIVGKAGTAKDVDSKPPPKEITQGNDLRTRLIPELEDGLSTLERLNKEKKWSKLTALLAVDPRAAEYAFRDDPEAVNLIRTFSLFRSKEFETAGKALTKMENQILSPLYQADLRSYEGIKNAMEKGIQEMKTTNASIEATYPFIKAVNEQVRRTREQTAVPPSTPPTSATPTSVTPSPDGRLDPLGIRGRR